jgi:hypothetical protein
MRNPVGILVLATLVVALTPLSIVRGEDDPAPLRPPPAGEIRFSASATAFPEDPKPVFGGAQTIYGLVGFGGPFADLLQRADKGTNVVLKLFEGEEQLTSHLFFPPVEAFDEEMYVLEVVPDPARTTQFNHKFARALAELEPGPHQLRIALWSFRAKETENDLASGTLTYTATAEAKAQLLQMADKIEEAKRAGTPPPPPPPAVPLVKVRHQGADFLQLRGDEIVKDGAVVGSFDGASVRRGGSIVGEIRGTTFRHEGADAWSLDQGNLYPGTEIRYEGSIIGSIEASGRITWEGSEWGNVSPFEGKPEETMRIFAALFYFSNYFQKR